MPSHTTVEMYSHILNILNKIGITPICQESMIHSKSETLVLTKEIRSNQLSGHGSKTEKHCSVFTIENPKHRNTTTSAFPILKFENIRNKSAMFWIMFVFFFGTAIVSSYKLIVTMQATQQSKMTWSETTSKMGIGTPVIVASFVYVVYSMTCCAAYFIHILKADQVCQFLTKWQIAEGQLITESEASILNGQSVESFINWQKKGLLMYLAGIPFSFVLMGFATTYNNRFPMYIYSSVPTDWKEAWPWIQPLCFIFAWIQAGLFLIGESQTELIAIAFTRSIYKCLEVLNQPATDFYKRVNHPRSHFEQSSIAQCNEAVATVILGIKSGTRFQKSTTIPNQDEMLLLFYDSVERYESLNHLMDEFNSIFRWPLFTRKGFTMAKICCYVYLLLRHPLDSAFSGLVIFLYAALAIFAKFGGILSLMASVRGESEKFLREWRKVLLVLSPNEVSEEERRLERCCRLQFKIGNFYTVKSQTLLTFSSVVLTYLIILLQL